MKMMAAVVLSIIAFGCAQPNAIGYRQGHAMLVEMQKSQDNLSFHKECVNQAEIKLGKARENLALAEEQLRVAREAFMQTSQRL